VYKPSCLIFKNLWTFLTVCVYIFSMLLTINRECFPIK
jgi:hypothetical protein